MEVSALRRTTRFRSLSVICALLLSAGLCDRLHAQALYGTIVGAITDQTGAVVPNANITATNVETGQVRTGVTDSDGRYSMGSILPGKYSVMVEAKGFKRFEQSGITVTPNTVSRVESALQIGQASEQVTVSERPPCCRLTKPIPIPKSVPDRFANCRSAVSGAIRRWST